MRPLSGNLDDSLGFLIADSSRYVKRSLYARIAAHGIRGGAWFVLRVLWGRDDVTQRELAHRLGLMEPSVQEMLRAMERDGLVTRQRDEQDRRKMRIRLTPRARKLEPVLMRIAADVNALMLTGLDASEEVQLKRLLGKVRSTLAADVEASATVLPEEPVAGARAPRRSTG
ncbi:MAG: MarR family winged helix-turn-helix transcriptional regulator [Burkholderiaceae bacterium]|nr:MarR family winged helix-turn-helix transcriptional regulator [Burkholderiaceae bacterium]